uniref:Ovule protein n=1 Tax=Steinernema glaseri TaxID=37863 RepID=A0A1I7ZT26_9BILA
MRLTDCFHSFPCKRRRMCLPLLKPESVILSAFYNTPRDALSQRLAFAYSYFRHPAICPPAFQQQSTSHQHSICHSSLIQIQWIIKFSASFAKKNVTLKA